MLFFLMHVAVRRLLRALGDSSVAALEVENAVLRHELAVLRRTVRRPSLRRRDRLLLAAASTLLPRERWSVFLVSPQTLLRWHRELPLAAVVVEARYSALQNLEHVNGNWLADQLARLEVRYPEIHLVFADSRRFAEDWTYRFLATALTDTSEPNPNG